MQFLFCKLIYNLFENKFDQTEIGKWNRDINRREMSTQNKVMIQFVCFFVEVLLAHSDFSIKSIRYDPIKSIKVFAILFNCTGMICIFFSYVIVMNRTGYWYELNKKKQQQKIDYRSLFIKAYVQCS